MDAVSDFRIAGIIPFSATDWPGKLTATAFTQGCPWRCRYCHNPALQGFSAGTQSLQAFLELLGKRKGLLDGAVISGGEPTAQRGLGAAIAAIHDAGFPVGLHTCGYLPGRLAALLDDAATRPEWIGIDVKGLPEDMPQAVGCSLRAAHQAWESLHIALEARARYGVGIEVRTTIWEGSDLESHLPQLRAQIEDLGQELIVHKAHDVDANGYYIGA